MKKHLFSLVVAILILVSSLLPTGHVAAAERTASLDDLYFVQYKGWVAVFEVTGTWKAADLKGHTLSVDGKTFDLYCNWRDEEHISCTTDSLAPYIGKPVVINFGGQVFDAIVPERRERTEPVFAECPSDTYEQVLVTALASTGEPYFGSNLYLADTFTVLEGAEYWVSLVESFFSVDLVSYTIDDVICIPMKAQ